MRQALIASEGPSPLGTRTFFYGNTILLDRVDMCCREHEATHLNLTVFSDNEVRPTRGCPPLASNRSYIFNESALCIFKAPY